MDFYSLFWYLSVTVALQCVVWWSIVKRMMKYVAKLSSFIEEQRSFEKKVLEFVC